jgi:hypothetical protein
MCLKDRAFEYIVANEEENPPAHVNLRQDQCYQWFPDLQQSKVCQRVRGRDVPAPVIRLIAIEKAVIRLKRQDAQTLAGSVSADVTLTQQFMGGSPATPVRPGRRPVVQMQGGGMSTPQSMAYHRPDTPGTLHQDDVEAEVRMLERQREWVRNPEYINEQDMKAMRRLGVNVIKMMVPTAHKHLVSKMKPLNFNSELKKLVVSTRTPLEKATKLRREIAGNMGENLSESHPRLKSIHDIPSYIEWMTEKHEELEDLVVDDRCKMRPGMLLEQIAHHVGRFISSVRSGFEERRESRDNPYTLDTIRTVVMGMEKSHAIDVDQSTEHLHALNLAQQSQGAPRFQQHQMKFDEMNGATARGDASSDHAMGTHQTRGQGAGAGGHPMGPSGRDYDAVQHGQDFGWHDNTPPGQPRFAMMAMNQFQPVVPQSGKALTYSPCHRPGAYILSLQSQVLSATGTGRV